MEVNNERNEIQTPITDKWWWFFKIYITQFWREKKHISWSWDLVFTFIIMKPGFKKKNRSHVNTPPRIRIPESPSNWCMLLTWDLVFFWNLVSCYETRFHNARVFFCSHRFIMVNSPLSCLFTNCHFALGRISLCTLCGPQSPFALFIGHALIILLLIQNNNIIILWLGDN